MNLFSRNPLPKEIPINVMVLGFPESGKTVLLTTMYHQLSVPGCAGFYLHTKDESKHNELMGMYQQVADPNDRFPEPNRCGPVFCERTHPDGVSCNVGMCLKRRGSNELGSLNSQIQIRGAFAGHFMLFYLLATVKFI